MPSELGRLRIYGCGDVEVDHVIEYLNDFRTAYNTILVFEENIERINRAWRRYPFPPDFAWASFGGSVRISDAEITALVPKSEQLVLSGVALQSPGFWDFLGKLNPLEVIRQYLNDRHERRKDREYREGAEERRLNIENVILANQAIAGVISNAKALGATDQDLAPLLNQLVYRPLEMLDHHQDRGTIDNAEIPTDPPSARKRTSRGG
jgi:hypothetical protein